MALPQITAIGNLTFEPEFQVTQSGIGRTRLRLACNERKKVDGEWTDGETTFIDVTLWRGLAESAAELHKGQAVMVPGKLRVRQYEDKNGNKGTSVEIDATDVATILAKPAKQQSDDLW